MINSMYSVCTKTFKCECDDCEVSTFNSYSYEEYPIINSIGNRIGTTFMAMCPECDTEALVEEYVYDNKPNAFKCY